ncbi:hypothetical protein ACSBR1_010085 [Camellia fascicularis]
MQPQSTIIAKTRAAALAIIRDTTTAEVAAISMVKIFYAKFGLSGYEIMVLFLSGVKSSFGYLDLEYFRCLQLTQKSDVYSFVVVLLEVLCARPTINNSLPGKEVNLAEWGLFWQKKGQVENVVDPLLVCKISPNSLIMFGETVEKCLKE